MGRVCDEAQTRVVKEKTSPLLKPHSDSGWKPWDPGQQWHWQKRQTDVQRTARQTQKPVNSYVLHQQENEGEREPSWRQRTFVPRTGLQAQWTSCWDPTWHQNGGHWSTGGKLEENGRLKNPRKVNRNPENLRINKRT